MCRSAMPSITAGRPFNTTSPEGGCFCNGEKGLLLSVPHHLNAFWWLRRDCYRLDSALSQCESRLKDFLAVSGFSLLN